jgi:multiple sugar transport system substrate-binding protein
VDLTLYYPSIMNVTAGGKVYALPTDIAPFGLMYYNKRMFREAGIPFPKADWKWPSLS